MKNTRKILFSAALLSSGLTMARTTTAEKSPNVIYIMADDLGIGDLGCYGQRQIKTPNIDGIAQNGMKFMQHYSGSTVSAPSRCALITGKHMGHAAIRGNAKVAGSDGLLYETPLPAGEVTVADIFKTKNYVTGCVGKWGMGGPGTEGMPGKHGFDYFYGYLGQRFAHSYYPEFLHENEQKIMLDGKYYSHDLMLEKALNFIDENAQKPFFLYFSPTIPHADLDIMGEAMTEYEGEFCETPFGGSRDGYKSQQNPRAAYAAMVTYLDKSVGLIIKELKEKGLYDHTIIVFTSDNGVHSEGGHDPSYFDSNGPFRGQKRDLYEGGIRTPFVIQWPGVIPQGVVTNHISAFWDFLPAVGSATKTSFRILPIRWSPTCPRSTKLRAAGVPSVPKNRRPPRWITTTWSKSTSKRRTTWPVFSCPGSNWPKGRSFRSCSIRRAIFSRSPVRPTTSSAAIFSSRTSMSAAGTRATPFRCTCARTIFSSAGSICRISRCRAV